MKTLKLALAGATLLAGLSAMSAANAADVYARGESLKDAPSDYMPAITWTGFYIGAHVGATVDHTIEGTECVSKCRSGEADLDNTGLAGLQIGYNWQTARNLVLGVEGDISFPFDEDDAGFDTLASVRGRLGYAFGKSMIYATGGVAFTGGDVFSDDGDGTTGWVVGAGFEHKLRDNLSFGVETLYYAFEDDFSGKTADGAAFHTEDFERDIWTVRARLSYHLGGGEGESLK